MHWRTRDESVRKRESLFSQKQWETEVLNGTRGVNKSFAEILRIHSYSLDLAISFRTPILRLLRLSSLCSGSSGTCVNGRGPAAMSPWSKGEADRTACGTGAISSCSGESSWTASTFLVDIPGSVGGVGPVGALGATGGTRGSEMSWRSDPIPGEGLDELGFVGRKLRRSKSRWHGKSGF